MTPLQATPSEFWNFWVEPFLPQSASDDPWWNLMVAWLAAVSGH